MGFTLIELIVGILIFAVAMVSVINFLQPQVRKGIDPIWQVRAASLAQSLSSEITAKAFDENSNLAGGATRCGENDSSATFVNCTSAANLGPDAGENRELFDDVDDYNGFNFSGANILSSLGLGTSVNGNNIYNGFTAQVSVIYDANLDGIADTAPGNKKLVLITITTPGGEQISASAVKGNF
ncbi:prepilin-type N-terminal cleavage/methylation domain-containing protein [Glaciecola sp. MH2013]|nr:prepilin-type N-terminal cleavage/methylation domain-containing protein [Glaciecola sp. MH2013]